jgi:hypothetical protein
MQHLMKFSKSGASAIVAIVAAGIMLTDGTRARDLRATGPMLGPSVSVLNSATTTTTITQPVVPKTTAAGPKSAGATPAAPTVEVRDHAPGGNADPCAKYRCDPGSRLKSTIARFENNPPTASFCAKGFPSGACYQGIVYHDETGHTQVFYMAFEALHGPPLPGQMEKFLNVLQQAEAKYNGATYKPRGVELANRASGSVDGWIGPSRVPVLPRDHRN